MPKTIRQILGAAGELLSMVESVNIRQADVRKSIDAACEFEDFDDEPKEAWSEQERKDVLEAAAYLSWWERESIDRATGAALRVLSEHITAAGKTSRAIEREQSGAVERKARRHRTAVIRELLSAPVDLADADDA